MVWLPGLRGAAGTQLAELVDDYEADLRGRELSEKHVRDTTKRVRRMIEENGWKVLGDIRPDAFVKWRVSLKLSPKTKKEFHLSANAFLNWLVQTDRLMVNPLAKVPHVETRGKQVRPSRAFTEDELRRLFAVAGAPSASLPDTPLHRATKERGASAYVERFPLGRGAALCAVLRKHDEGQGQAGGAASVGDRH